MQAAHLVTLYGGCPRTRWWHRIFHADIGQREYCDVHGSFPGDQRAFVEAYLARAKDLIAQHELARRSQWLLPSGAARRRNRAPHWRVALRAGTHWFLAA